eukprot:scaffold146683_cov35-Attheya_sp.AAC.2
MKRVLAHSRAKGALAAKTVVTRKGMNAMLGLVIIHAGLKKAWTKQVLDILKYDLSILGGELVHYTYSRCNLCEADSTDSSLDNVYQGAIQNDALTTTGNWLILHSEDFNNIKHAYDKLGESSLNKSTNEKHPGYNIFSKLSYSPEVIQRGGGYVCGALACIVIETLLNITDDLHYSSNG